MILRLLKKLRTIRRKDLRTTNTSWRATLEQAATRYAAAGSPIAVAIRFPASINLRTQSARWIACLGLALAVTPLANAQQFQTPTLPGQSSAHSQSVRQVTPELQARLQHADALKAQMERAQFEQGAPNEFAQKAYEAQQAYQAERAFDEYTAFLNLQREQQRRQPTRVDSNQSRVPAGISRQHRQRSQVEVAHAAGLNSTNAQTSVQQSNLAPPVQQSTFAPPVHVAPPAGQQHASSRDQTQPQELDRTRANAMQQVTYQRAENQQNRNAAQPLYSYQPPQSANNQPTQARPPAHRQLATTQRMIVQKNSVASRSETQRPTSSNLVASHAPQTMNRNREYILSEKSHEGLQDRISSLLSKPRYRDSDSRVAQTDQAPRLANRSGNSSSQNKQRRVRTRPASVNPQHQTSHRDSLSGRSNLAANRTTAPTSRSNQTAKADRRNQPTPAAERRRDSEVQYAFEMQQRMERTMQNRLAVQQVAMVEPVQDPFNDQSVEMPPSSNAPRLHAPQSSFGSTLDSHQHEVLPPPADRRRPAKQISVLSNRSQDNGAAQGNQFGQPLRAETNPQPPQDFQPPVQGNQDQGFQSPQDLQRTNDELQRRMQELDNNTGDESSRVDDMVRELEQDLENNRAQQNDSTFEDRLNDGFDESSQDQNGRSRSNFKTCDEFRTELLDSSIRDIALDISPLAGRNRTQSASVSRDWMDRSGNVVATGMMVDLRRGYVIIDGINGRQKIAYARLSEPDWAVISKYWQIPELCSVGNQGDASRHWVPQTYTWKASSLCHKPLFFENIQLERYGHTHGPFMQPIRSFAHFFVSFVTVPYQSGIHPATECQYALGFYRPGDCAPWLKDPIPFSLNGAKRQALAVTGVAVLP